MPKAKKSPLERLLGKTPLIAVFGKRPLTAARKAASTMKTKSKAPRKRAAKT